MSDSTFANSAGVRGIFYFLVVVSQTTSLAMVLLLAIWAGMHDKSGLSIDTKKPLGNLNVHMITMPIAFACTIEAAIILFRLFRFLPHFAAKLAHGTIHTIALAFAAFGIVNVHHFATNISKIHYKQFHTTHSWYGLATIGSYLLQYMFGFVVFLLLPLVADRATAKLRAALVPIHRKVGIAIFVLTSAQITSGLTYGSYVHNGCANDGPDALCPGQLYWNVAGILMWVFTASTITLIATPAFQLVPPQHRSNKVDISVMKRH